MAADFLRDVHPADLDVLFEQMRDPESVWMAALTPPDPDDRAALDERMSRPVVARRTIVADGRVAGHIACFVMDGEAEITYWVARDLWGRGIAGRALELFVGEVVRERPLFGRAASDNIGSLRVLQRAGFTITGTAVGRAAARGAVIEETLLRLG